MLAKGRTSLRKAAFCCLKFDDVSSACVTLSVVPHPDQPHLSGVDLLLAFTERTLRSAF